MTEHSEQQRTQPPGGAGQPDYDVDAELAKLPAELRDRVRWMLTDAWWCGRQAYAIDQRKGREDADWSGIPNPFLAQIP